MAIIWRICFNFRLHYYSRKKKLFKFCCGTHLKSESLEYPIPNVYDISVWEFWRERLTIDEQTCQTRWSGGHKYAKWYDTMHDWLTHISHRITCCHCSMPDGLTPDQCQAIVIRSDHIKTWNEKKKKSIYEIFSDFCFGFDVSVSRLIYTIRNFCSVHRHSNRIIYSYLSFFFLLMTILL